MFFGVSSQKSAKNLAFQRVRKNSGFAPFCSQKWILGRTPPLKHDSAGPLIDDRIHEKGGFCVKSQFEYYEEIKRTFPRTMSKDQFYQAAHISKATALYLLQSGLVPCKDSGKKTRRYTIKTTM